MNWKELLALWLVIAFVSPTSELACQLVTGSVPGYFLGLRIASMAAVLVSTVYVGRFRPLLPFSCAYSFQLALVAAREIARSTRLYESAEATYGFIGRTLFLDVVLLVVLMPAIVWFVRSPGRFFFRIGNLNARLGFARFGGGENQWRWSGFAPVFAVVAAAAALLFVSYGRPAVSFRWILVLWAVLFAAINSFDEELMHRNILLAAVEPGFGARQATLVSAFIFAIGHWNGLPAGALGVLMTFALGYVAAKAMIETRGMFWSWFMHFVPDCVLIYYWASGAVSHGQMG
jgi:membrane protease YdiL (CAAX protease family)